MPASQDRTAPPTARGQDDRRPRWPARRSWVLGILALLLTLTLGAAPAEHARMVLARAAAVAEAGAAHHAHGMPAGEQGGAHDRHLLAPACLACVLMAAPGLPAGPSATPERVAVVEAVLLPFGPASGHPGAAWTPTRARAPPLVLPV